MSDLIYDCLERMGGRGITQTSEGYELRCPICRSKHRSMRVAWESAKTGDVGSWICHNASCGKKGNIVGLIMRAYRMPLAAAMEFAKDAHIQIYATRPPRPEVAEIGQEHIAPFRLHVPEYLVGRGYSPEWLWYYGIGYDRAEDEVVAPVYSTDSKLVGTSRRLARDGQPWVMSSFRKNECLWGYNLELAQDKNASPYIVEGIGDALGLAPHTAPDPVLTPFGTTISETQASLLADRYNSVVLAFDNDPGGWAGTKKAIRVLRDVGLPKIWILSYNTSDPGALPEEQEPEFRLQSTIEWTTTQKKQLEAWIRRKAEREAWQSYEEHK